MVSFTAIISKKKNIWNFFSDFVANEKSLSRILLLAPQPFAPFTLLSNFLTLLLLSLPPLSLFMAHAYTYIHTLSHIQRHTLSHTQTNSLRHTHFHTNRHTLTYTLHTQRYTAYTHKDTDSHENQDIQTDIYFYTHTHLLSTIGEKSLFLKSFVFFSFISLSLANHTNTTYILSYFVSLKCRRHNNLANLKQICSIDTDDYVHILQE
jgi:hypothetical protein